MMYANPIIYNHGCSLLQWLDIHQDHLQAAFRVVAWKLSPWEYADRLLHFAWICFDIILKVKCTYGLFCVHGSIHTDRNICSGSTIAAQRHSGHVFKRFETVPIQWAAENTFHTEKRLCNQSKHGKENLVQVCVGGGRPDSKRLGTLACTHSAIFLIIILHGPRECTFGIDANHTTPGKAWGMLKRRDWAY